MSVKLIKESQESLKDWSVKSLTFDVAIKGSDISKYGLSGQSGGKFFKSLSNFLKSQGMEMAGDFIEVGEDLTEFYKDNDYEFFTESVKYPNGVVCKDDSVEMDLALDYMYSTDRDPDNSHYTEDEKQRAVDYYIDKFEHSPYRKSKSLKEGYSDGTVSTSEITDAINSLEELVEMMDDAGVSSIQASSSTYGLGQHLIGFPGGFIDYNDVYRYVSGDDEEYYEESLKESAFDYDENSEEDLRESKSLQKGDELTIYWNEPGFKPYAYADVTFIGKTKDGRYKMKSNTYGTVYTVDLKNNTVTTPGNKTYEINNDIKWTRYLEDDAKLSSTIRG